MERKISNSWCLTNTVSALLVICDTVYFTYSGVASDWKWTAAERQFQKCNTFTCVNQGSVCALIAVSVQGDPEHVSRDQFCISWWLLILDASHFMASQLHFVSIKMIPNASHTWWFAGLFTLKVIVTFQFSLISEIIVSEKGGAGNTNNISVWSISIHGSFIGPLFNNTSNFQCEQAVPVKGLGCSMCRRTASPLVLANSRCFCLDCQHSDVTGVPFLVLALMGDFFTCQILMF